MYFINLDTLKIVKSFNYETKSIDIKLNGNESVNELKHAINHAVKNSDWTKPAIECIYEINFDIDGVADIDNFLTYVNIAAAVFTSYFTSAKGRKRERRLDVPEELKVCNGNMSLLKKMINSQTSADIFNLIVKCGDFTYYLCDGKEAK